jgi:tryptophanyl-tRNA synthetase
MQPSGDLTLGNYLGALKRWVAGQEEKENFFCVVDLHTLTVPQDPDALRHRTRMVAAIYLAAGIDPEKCTLFVQSHVSAHAEGCWLLNCVTPIGWLQKMTQFKDKSSRQESVLTGLLDYPVLMAADILLYDADEVPVGDDQKQHVELARNVAERFNHLYGETFVVPKPMIAKEGARIMGLDNPEVKMSKSYEHIRGHLVKVVDDPKDIEWAFKRAVTDSGKEIRFSDDPAKAGVNNLLTIYKVITGRSNEDVERDFENARGYGDLKMRVAEVVIEELAPIRRRVEELMSDTTELDRILSRGADQARSIANVKLDEMKRKMGLIVRGG